MTSNIINYKNYTEFNDTYQLVLPLNLESLIPEDNSVRLHSHVMEGLDYTKLYPTYASTGRKPAVEPQIMCKVVTYAYSQKIYSSRKIEANANRYTFVWKRVIKKNEEKMYPKVEALVDEVNQEEMELLQ